MPITYENDFICRGTCDFCGEKFDSEDPRPSVNEFAEFWDPSMPEGQESKMMHGECGINSGLQMA